MAASKKKKRGRGRPVVHGERSTALLRLPPDLHRLLRHVALDDGVSLNALIVEVLEAWWSEHPDRGAYERLAHRRKR